MWIGIAGNVKKPGVLLALHIIFWVELSDMCFIKINVLKIVHMDTLIIILRNVFSVMQIAVNKYL